MSERVRILGVQSTDLPTCEPCQGQDLQSLFLEWKKYFLSDFKNIVSNGIVYTNGIVASCIIIGCILLASDELFRVKKVSIGTSSDLINHSWLQVNKNSSGNMFASTSLSKECCVGVISPHHLVRRNVTIRLDPMLQAIQFPTGIPNLASSLTNMNRYALPL